MPEFQFFCPTCGQHIQCDTNYIGSQINCPVCKQAIVVPQAPNAIATSTPAQSIQIKAATLRKVLGIALAIAAIVGLVAGCWYFYLQHTGPKVRRGMVALWSGNGGGHDKLGGPKAQVPKGIAYARSKVGLAFKFDGKEHRIIVPDSPELNFDAGKDFSVTAWIKPMQTPTTGGVMSIVDKRSDGPSGESPGYEFSLENGRIHTRILRIGFGPAGPDLCDGKFHYVAVAVHRNSSTGGHLFVDGQDVLTFGTTQINGDLTNDAPLRIGNHCSSAFHSFFKGLIDAVAIYNRALSASEIREIYQDEKSH